MPTGSRKSEPDPNQIPLPFKLPRASRTGTTDNPGRRGATQPVFAYAYCSHHSGEKRTGLVLSGQHIVWKVHYIMLGKGTSVPCRASGVALCVAATRDGQMVLNQTPKHRDADPMHGVRNSKCFHKDVA